MRFGNYSVLIPEGTEGGDGYVGLPHGRQYTLRLGNHSYKRCHATVRLDGREVGTWVMRANETITLERGAEDSGRFTFYAVGTTEHAAVGGDSLPTADRGLVQVEFTPERERISTPAGRRSWVSRGGPCGQSQGPSYGEMHAEMTRSGGLCSFDPTRSVKTSGVTGLSGQSGQQFVTVAGLDLDHSGKTLLSLRLVLRQDGPRPVRDVRQAGNPVPAPVG